ncbi:MAG TPA: CHRD domain-containing protein [Acetobacteraceae bacterium]
MSNPLSRRMALGVAGLALGGLTATAQAAPMKMTVPLTGAQQVPPVQTPGHGSADLTYDPSSRVLTWNITFNGLSGPATMAHIHGPAPTGKNAGVEVWLSKQGQPAASPIKGQATLTPAQAQQLMAGNTYINIHTQAHPGGEIRGQIMPSQT